MSVARVSFDDAFEALISALRRPAGVFGSPNAQHECDIFVPVAVLNFWQEREPTTPGDLGALTADQVRPFADAAWELCRMGILRPGQIAPGGYTSAGGGAGAGFSLTAIGRKWILDNGERPRTDPSSLAALITPLTERLGAGFQSRATEANACYRAANYLACCAMAGAAAESILLAIASARLGSEHNALGEYRRAGGRTKVIDRVCHGLGGVGDGFRQMCGLLSVWRDEASHGAQTTISEAEARMALVTLLRLAQFTADNWSRLADER